MTTLTYSSVLNQQTDAAFRTWGAEVGTNFAAAGLVQTADSGQINWASVVRAPATNTAAGYQIWRFADSTIYFKIEFGSGSTSSVPAMWLTGGTGSNGSGTLTGQTSTRAQIAGYSLPASIVTAYTSYLCVTADVVALLWKVGGNSAGALLPIGFFVLGKTVDGTGAATTIGYGVLRFSSGNTATFQSVRIASPAASYNESNYHTVIPGVPASSVVSGSFQAYEIWMNVPDVQPFAWANVVLVSEIAAHGTFAVAMVSSLSRTYLCMRMNGSIGQYSANTYTYGMIWE